jgi:hypothetical protein
MGNATRIRPREFFRSKLLSLKTYEEVQELFLEHRQDIGRMRQHIHTICWHMRGGVTREEAWSLSPFERRDIMKLIDDHVKLTEKTGLPLI